MYYGESKIADFKTVETFSTLHQLLRKREIYFSVLQSVLSLYKDIYDDSICLINVFVNAFVVVFIISNLL